VKPNILLLHCHDLGDHLGCYGDPSATTPNIDRLAEQSVRFARYFAASPTCSPSRGAMLTGLMPHRNGLMALASGGHWEVDPDVATLPALLQQAGYATACFGTWHISAEFWDRGIEVGHQDAGLERATADAVDYLEDPPADRPFFLMVGVGKPHLPWETPGPDPEDVRLPGYLAEAPEPSAVREELSRFYGEVQRMDQAMGRIIAALEARDLDEDTLVIFTSDHGIGMPLAKGTLYDPGVKIPLIIRRPGSTFDGRRYEGLTSNVDLLPTVLEAVGAGDLTPGGVDGRSLWPVVAGEDVAPRDHIFTEQTWHDFYEPIRAVRTDRYKLIRNFEPGPGLQVAADILQTRTTAVMREQLRAWPRPEIELYDLQDDPWERENLAEERAFRRIRNELEALLDAWLVETQDPILDGVVPAPPGYWEHFCAKSVGPGRLPPAEGRDAWVTVRWPSGATEHRCATDK
jgi:arylsulfatase A-like enzyme